MSAQGSNINSDEEDNGSSQGVSMDGSYEGESGEYSSEAGSGSEEDGDDEEPEPVLKYKRFAKEVVNSINEGSDGDKNIICCIAVHAKVNMLVEAWNAVGIYLNRSRHSAGYHASHMCTIQLPLKFLNFYLWPQHIDNNRQALI